MRTICFEFLVASSKIENQKEEVNICKLKDVSENPSYSRVSRRATLRNMGLLMSMLPGFESAAQDTVPSGKSESSAWNTLTALHKRGFAMVMEHSADLYEKTIGERKRNLFEKVFPDVGRVVKIVDIGMGTGPNFKYYPPGSEVIGIEPNKYMWEYAEQKAKTFSLPLEICESFVEDLPLQDDSCDIVVSTLTLCSVESPMKAVAEIARVLKPGGKFVFIEHVIADDSEWILKAAQRVFNPLQRAVADGCNLTRNTEGIIRTVGEKAFSDVEVQHFSFDPCNWLVRRLNLERPHISGYAVKRG